MASSHVIWDVLPQPMMNETCNSFALATEHKQRFSNAAKSLKKTKQMYQLPGNLAK